jgi:hypothetical protein
MKRTGKGNWDSAMNFQLKSCFLPHVMRRKTWVLIAVMVLLIHATAFCEGTDVEEGKMQGAIDAKSDKMWFFPGCLLPGLGLILPWVSGPTVPSEMLIGKSPEYVEAYQKAFVRKVKFGNFLWALLGFGTTVAVVAVVGGSVGIIYALGYATTESCMEIYRNPPNLHCISLLPSPGMGLLPQDLMRVIAAP